MKRNRYATQGACIVVALMNKPHTYMEMMKLGLSISPWKRAAEYLDRHPGLKLVKTKSLHGGEWLTTWRVVKVKP